MSHSARGGFKRRDAMVAIVAVGALLALGLPLLRQNRDRPARRNTCANNMNQIGKAMIIFENGRNYFPGYVNGVKRGESENNVSYFVTISSLLERNDVYRGFTDESVPYEWQYCVPYMSLLVCPSNPPDTQQGAPLAYVLNSGNSATADAADGICHSQAWGSKEPKVSMDYISAHDGTSETLLLSENMQAKTWVCPTTGFPAAWITMPTLTSVPQSFSADRSPTIAEARRFTTFVWFNEQTPTASHQINRDKDHDAQFTWTNFDYSRPSSNHANGVNVIFCDGHLRFISEDIAYGVYKQLMTPNGAESSDSENCKLSESDY